MASYFNLILDTLAPQGVSLKINGGQTATASKTVTLTIGTTDTPTTGYRMKIWGVAGILTEADASWETFTTSKQVTLPDDDGAKTVSLKIQDDVFNESAVVTASITLNTAVPTVTVNAPDYSKISRTTARNTATFTFTPDSDITEWKVCYVPTISATESQGTVIPSDNGSTNMTGTTKTANTEVSCSVKGEDLYTVYGSDKVGIIKVFVKNTLGVWSV